MSDLWFVQREKQILGSRYEEMYTAPEHPFRAITINPLRTIKDDLKSLKPSPFCAQSFYLPQEETRPGRHAYHHAGAYYVQEPSAAMAATLLQVKPGEMVLDLCAAPGGKSSQLAAALQGQGMLVSNEYETSRANILKNNLERMGVTNAIVLNETTTRIAKTFGQYFDKILVDAPCSGEGMFRKETQAVTQHSPQLVQQCAELGAKILQDAAQCLKPGGLLCYSTCTFSPQEDEMQIGAFLNQNPQFCLLKIETEVGSEGEVSRCGDFVYEVENTRRIYPCHGGEGHFMALLQYTGTAPQIKQKSQKEKPADLVYEAFIREYFPALQGKRTMQVGSDIYLVGTLDTQTVKKLHVLRAGVKAGEIIKGRFVPAHALAMAYGDLCINKESLALTDNACNAWLRGEQISARQAVPGWAIVQVDGLSLGWGKCSNGVLKNHYPKGLRNLN